MRMKRGRSRWTSRTGNKAVLDADAHPLAHRPAIPGRAGCPLLVFTDRLGRPLIDLSDLSLTGYIGRSIAS
jgi:hypothetical protein